MENKDKTYPGLRRVTLENPTEKSLKEKLIDVKDDILDFFIEGDGAYVPAIALTAALAFGGAMWYASKNAQPTYTIKSTDLGLSYIAKEQLGDASRYKELYELNKDVIGSDMNKIKPGMKLKLPRE